MIPVLESHRQFWGRLASWPHSGQQAASRVRLHLSKVESNKDDTCLRCQAFLRTHVHHAGAHSHAHTRAHSEEQLSLPWEFLAHSGAPWLPFAGDLCLLHCTRSSLSGETAPRSTVLTTVSDVLQTLSAYAPN